MNRSDNQGFTLIEVMVAIGMFAIISLAATQMLRTIVTSHELTEKRVEFFSGLTRTVSILERDFSQILPRPVKDEYGSPRPAVIISGSDYITEFTRAGWNNPLGRIRSNVQRVAYSINEEDELVRHFWKVLDRAEDSEPVDQVLMDGVKSFRLTALNKDGETVDAWPDQNTNDPMPLAVEVFLETEVLGEIRRVFVLPQLAVVTKPPGGGNNNGANNNNRNNTNNTNNNNSNNNNTNNGGQNFDPDL